MDPSTVRRFLAAVAWPKLAFWAAALAVGAYLGSKIAELSDPGGMFGPLGAILSGLIALTILGTLAVLAVFLAREPDGRGRPAARSMIVAGVLLTVGVGVGWAITSVLRLGSLYPDTREANGTMNVSINGIDGYEGHQDAIARCRFSKDSETVSFVEAYGVGRVRTGEVGVSVLILPEFADDPPAVQVWIVPADKAPGGAPAWRGPLGAVEGVGGDGSGSIVFSGLALTASDETGLPPDGWPTELSGTISWSCESPGQPEA